MLSDLGDDALITACLVALFTAIGGHCVRENKAGLLYQACRTASIAVFGLVLAAFGLLMLGFITSDFSLAAVYQNSHIDKPLLYKMAGVWGNHEGSMLLWALVASFYGALFACFPPARLLSPPFAARVMATQQLLLFGFLLFILGTSDPFAPLFPVPLQGLGLNPLLQDPALAAHPPLLYLGYVGFSLAFSFAVAGLLTGEVNAAFATALRPYVLLAWSALTIGIALGSWWAYYELGWGGWWFWDPVENASLIPWLAGTALLHSLRVLEQRGTLKSWVVLLALITFTLALIGTFLVRSGIITSVHAFAADSARGVFVLLLIGLSAGYGLLLFALRGHLLGAESHIIAPLSRESLLLLNNVFLTAGFATMLIGTLYPVIMEILFNAPLSVGPPYYQATFIPMLIPLVVLMGVAPFMAWQQTSLPQLRPWLRRAFGISVGVSLAIAAFYPQQAWRFYLGISLASWLAVTTLLDAWRGRVFRPMHIAHIGLAVFLFGAVASSHLSQEVSQLMQPGDSMKLADGRTLRFTGIARVSGKNFLADRAAFTLINRDNTPTLLHPERRFYPLQEKVLAKIAITTTGLEDVYLVLGEPQQDDAGKPTGWSIRAATHPLAPWIWLGCLLMAVGGVQAGVLYRVQTGMKKGQYR